MQYLPGRLIKGVTGKLRSDDTARLSRGVAVSSSHLSSSSFLWSFTHFISGDPDLKIWSFGAFFISQTNKSGIKRTRKQHGHKSSYWSLTFRWIQSTCWKNYCDKIGLLKNNDLQRYLYQSHIGSVIGLWNISLVNASLHWCSYFPSHLCHLGSSKELISQQVLSDRRLHLMLVGTSTYGAAGKFQRLPPINIQQHGKIRITLVCNDSWTVGCPKKTKVRILECYLPQWFS